MNICICDDDSFACAEVKKEISAFFSDDMQPQISTFSSGEDLLKALNESGHIDIFFLDIEMNEVSGLQVAEEIRKTDKDAIIIFVSSHSKYVFETIRYEILHFIVKPIDHDEFIDVFSRAVKKYNSMHDFVYVCWESTRSRILVQSITYVEGYQRHLMFHTLDGVYETVGKLSDIFEQLKPHGFLRIHQGFVVNMKYIKSFGIKEVILTDNSNIEISARSRKAALESYNTYIQKWKW